MDSDRLRLAFFALLLAAFGYLVLTILAPFLPYVLAVLLLAYVLAPLQRRLRPRIGARAAAFALVVGSVAALVIPVTLLALALPADATALSRGAERLLDQRRIDRGLERTLGVDLPIESVLADAPTRIADALVGDVGNLFGAATHAFLGVVLLVFLLYYLLKDGERLVDWVREMTPLEPAVQDELVAEARATTRAVLEGHVLVAVVQGVVAGVGLWLVGIPHVVFWTVVMAFLELFPVVGVAGVLGPAVLYLGVTGRLLAAGFLLVYGVTAVALVDDYLRAEIVERGSSLHSGVILLGVFGGVYAFGVVGLFYGPIVVGLFAALVRLGNEHYVSG